MEPLYARYPFLSAAREAVEEADVDLAELAREGAPAVERGRERVERALLEGTVEPEGRPGTRTELLSYPVARVLVSLLDAPGAVEKYASAEAAAAHDRFTDDFEDDSRTRETLSLDDLLAEFDLTGRVTHTGEGFAVDVGAYLPLASGLDGADWRLVNRALADGRVRVSRPEVYELLCEAVRARIVEELPLEVPEPIAEPLAPVVADLREVLAEVDLPRDVDAVVPDLFPPCMTHLLAAIRRGEDLEAHSRFVLVAFLANIGMDAEGIVDLCGIESPERADEVRYRTARLRDDAGAQYAPPTCATMQAYGDCVNMDDLCETIAHPLEYYEKRLALAGRGVRDWRDYR